MKDVIKELYIQGKTVDEICAALNIARQTFYYHKKADFKKGIDWDGLKLANLRSEDELENKEALFVNSLIENYEKFKIALRFFTPILSLIVYDAGQRF